jgi:hypothetical protein
MKLQSNDGQCAQVLAAAAQRGVRLKDGMLPEKGGSAGASQLGGLGQIAKQAVGTLHKLQALQHWEMVAEPQQQE